jgi:hypothetical protein
VLDADIVGDEKIHHVGGDPFHRDDSESGGDAKADPDVRLHLVKLGAGKLGKLGGIDRHLNCSELTVDVVRAAKLGQDLQRGILRSMRERLETGHDNLGRRIHGVPHEALGLFK